MFLNAGNSLFQIIFGIILGAGFVIFCILLLLIYLLEVSKGKLYKMFLEVPSECLKILYSRSETFVSSVSSLADDDAASVDNLDQDDDSQTLALKQVETFSKCIF